MKCISCGGEAKSAGAGEYRCTCCGRSFSASEAEAANRPAQSQFQVRTAQPYASEGVNVFDKNINGTMEIRCDNCAGSGFLIDKSGFALTNTHVVTENSRPCNNIIVKIAGENVRARIIALGDNKGGLGNGVDLALLRLERVPMTATPVTLGNFADVRIGQQVFVIGNSLGHGTCMTSGIVSDKSRNVNGKQLLMTDCAINGGNSGGPMFNDRGEVIGVIVSGITGAEGMNFAIPVSTVKDFLSRVTII